MYIIHIVALSSNNDTSVRIILKKKFDIIDWNTIHVELVINRMETFTWKEC